MNTTSKTTRISALLPTNLVEEIRNISNQENKTQSSIIKNALEFWFKKKLEKDAKALSEIKFDDLPSEDEWFSIQPKI